ncbi:LicD family protein [Sharpea azabuensis]|uniref:LicD family protein n=1 Tax=Sharpea azabuensis TaxID=322505 RepID=UPI001566200B|nr:LicD family protein [Sharpea azabuensis]
MKNIERNEIQPILLNLLKQFKVYSEKHNLTFMLCGGTLLGAVRHKGFIPWDDDIDLFVTKETFKKLMKIVDEDPYLDDERRYKILAPGSKDYIYPYFKVIDTKTIAYEKNINKKYAIGIWIDIFCLSFIPENEAEYMKMFKKQRFYKNINKLQIAGSFSNPFLILITPFLKFVQVILNLFGLSSHRCIKKILDLDKVESSNIVGNVHWPLSPKDRYKKEWFQNIVKLEFEDDEYYVPIGYKEVLESLYGNYMQLPPVEERVQHPIKAFYLEDDLSN